MVSIPGTPYWEMYGELHKEEEGRSHLSQGITCMLTNAFSPVTKEVGRDFLSEVKGSQGFCEQPGAAELSFLGTR